MRILIVDDDVDLANLIAEALCAAGHEVAIHNGGESKSLLAYLVTGAFDLVLLDLDLGPFDSAALVHALALTDRRPTLILCTGAVETRIAPLRAHVDGVLHKPFGFEELFAAVDTATSQQGPPCAA